MTEDCFAASYSDARGRFLAAVEARGQPVQTMENTHARGPAGERLCTDVARFGPTDADALLIVNSATHGVEGYCGSGCQVRLLREGWDAPRRVAILFSHALNPYGFAHDRRVNEDNVDLNRNFIDHSGPKPAAPGYRELHPHLVPESSAGRPREAADAGLAASRAALGASAFQAAMTSGQYEFPDGLFFGGAAPTWSNRTWRAILNRHVGGARKVAFIDLHTGLGPNGAGELIVTGTPDAATLARAGRYWGEVRSTASGESSSAPVRGDLPRAFDAFPQCEVTAVALEFGTVPLDEMLEAVRWDNWLYAKGCGAHSPDFAAIKARIRAAFYDESPEWKRAVSDRARLAFDQALAGLAEGMR